MHTNDDHTEVSKGDEYRHPNGTVEVVFATEDDRVLAVREYRTTADFLETVAGAAYRGTNEAVASLPAVDAFRPEPDGDDATVSGAGEEDDRTDGRPD